MTMRDKNWSLADAIEQIDKCNFECEGGTLANSAAYQWLKGAARVWPGFMPGQGVYFEATAETKCGEKLSAWKHYFVVGCHMDSNTEDRIWTYDLSNDPPAPWHYGTVQHQRVAASKLRLEIPALSKATTGE